MGGIDMLFYSPHNVDSRAITFMSMSYPFIFVCCMFMTFRTKIIAQDDKIKELEDKITQIVLPISRRRKARRESNWRN